MRRSYESVRQKWQRAINLLDVVRKLIKNCCGLTQMGIHDNFRRSNKKAVHSIYGLTGSLRRTFMASGFRPITDVVPADEDVEEKNEDDDTQKDGDNSGSDSGSDNGKQEDNIVVGDRAEQDSHGNGWTLTCHILTRSSRNNMRQKLVALAMGVSRKDSVNREAATVMEKVMDPNTMSPKATGQKTTCWQAMRPNMTITKEMIIKVMSMNEAMAVRKTRSTNSSILLLIVGTRTSDKT